MNSNLRNTAGLFVLSLGAELPGREIQAGGGEPDWGLPAVVASLLALVAVLVGWLRALRASRALARAGERWRAFVEASPIPVLIVGDGGRILYQNPRARDLGAGAGGEDRLAQLWRRPDVRAKLELAKKSRSPITNFEVALRSNGSNPGETEWLSLSLAACDVDEGRAVLVSFVDITSQKDLEVTLRREVDTDALTGALSRRRVLSVLEAFVRRGRVPLALGILDIDHFKAINDGHGHAFGDRVLVELVRACQQVLRGNDVIGRIGGEEFLVLLPGADAKAALAAGERLRGHAESALASVDGVPARVTISLGFAVAVEPNELEGLQLLADRALYRAKASGRNRVCLADASDEAPASRAYAGQ